MLRNKLNKRIKVLECELRDLIRTNLDDMTASEQTKHYIKERELTFAIKNLKGVKTWKTRS